MTPKPFIVPTNTLKSTLNRLVPLCSDMADQLGERVTCQIERAYCEYLPGVNGSPTFCDDRPYPNQDFQLVVFGDDWSDLDGECLIVSGFLERYTGRLQIKAGSPFPSLVLLTKMTITSLLGWRRVVMNFILQRVGFSFIFN